LSGRDADEYPESSNSSFSFLFDSDLEMIEAERSLDNFAKLSGSATGSETTAGKGGGG
jgi:hypothetical protein